MGPMALVPGAHAAPAWQLCVAVGLIHRMKLPRRFAPVLGFVRCQLYCQVNSGRLLHSWKVPDALQYWNPLLPVERSQVPPDVHGEAAVPTWLPCCQLASL